jgi:hypothetical protein
MNNRISSSVSLLVVAAALAMPSLALAQVDTRCRPDDLLCADVDVGPIEGHLRIGPGDAPPPPPVVVEPPPVVVVTPPPPPPPPPPIQPPVVVIQQTPPPPPIQPVVVVAPQPREPQVVQVQTVRQRRVVYDLVPDFDIGLRLDASALFADRSMGGLNAALRIRPERHVAIDVGSGFWYGSDFNNRERWEMPVQADLLVFFNPEHMFQVYGLIGGGMTFGSGYTYTNPGSLTMRQTDLMYAGGEIGLGLELRLSRFFALNLDVRGFLRQRVGGSGVEFWQRSGNLIQTTDTSMGMYGTLGMTFYFIGN